MRETIDVKKQNVHVFVFDSLSDWEASYAIASINNPQFQKNPGRYQVRTVASSMSLVESAGGMRIQPDMVLNELSPADSAMLILPGGSVWDQGGNVDAVDKARQFLDADTPVAAICGATGALARGGLLDDRRHTSNALEYLSYTGYAGAELYENVPAVTDKNLITASGTAPVDFARHILRILGVYSASVLEAWYGLYKTGQAKYFADLMEAIK